MDRHSSCPLLLAEAGGDTASLQKIRELQKELGAGRDWSVALLTRGEPTQGAEDPLIRPVAWPTAEDAAWQPVLDELAGLD